MGELLPYRVLPDQTGLPQHRAQMVTGTAYQEPLDLMDQSRRKPERRIRPT